MWHSHGCVRCCSLGYGSVCRFLLQKEPSAALLAGSMLHVQVSCSERMKRCFVSWLSQLVGEPQLAARLWRAVPSLLPCMACSALAFIHTHVKTCTLTPSHSRLPLSHRRPPLLPGWRCPARRATSGPVVISEWGGSAPPVQCVCCVQDQCWRG